MVYTHALNRRTFRRAQPGGQTLRRRFLCQEDKLAGRWQVIAATGFTVPSQENPKASYAVQHQPAREEKAMRIAKNDVPVRINVPGAVARQKNNFGDATGYGKISAEYFSLGAGTDISPLLVGLKGDLCQSPHWGYVLQGVLTVTYADGTQETVNSGDLFYWPPGHTVKVSEDAELILFSPQHEHGEVIEHMLKKMSG
jgi:hypothetical protein